MTETEHRRVQYTTVFVMLVFILLYSFVQNYSFLVSDSFDHLLFIERFKDPSFLSQDGATNQIPAYNVRFFFATTMAYLSYLIPLDIAFFLVFIINGVFLLLGIFALSLYLFKDRRAAYLSAFIVTFSIQKIAGDFAILAPYLTQPQISMTLSIWAFYFFFRKKYNIMYLLLGLSTLNHIMIGLNSAILLSLALLFYYRIGAVKHYARGALFYFPFAIFTLVPIFVTSLRESALVDPLQIMYIYAYVRVPWHMMPLQFNLAAWASFL